MQDILHILARRRVLIQLKIFYSNFLFIHHEVEVGTYDLSFDIVKTATPAEICFARWLKEYSMICIARVAIQSRA